MSLIVVTILDGRGGRRDLELPGDVPLSTLGPAIAEAVHHPNLGFTGPGFAHPSGRTYPFRGNSVLIGRVDRSSGIVSKVLGVDLTDLEEFEGPSVSRRHAQVLLRDGEYLLQDLRSTNGTLVNGRLLEPETRSALNHGDEIQFGDIALFFLWDSQEKELTSTEEQRSEMGGLE